MNVLKKEVVQQKGPWIGTILFSEDLYRAKCSRFHHKATNSRSVDRFLFAGWRTGGTIQGRDGPNVRQARSTRGKSVHGPQEILKLGCLRIHFVRFEGCMM